MAHYTPEEALFMVGCARELSSLDWALITAVNAKVHGDGIALRIRVEFGLGPRPPARETITYCGFQLWEGLEDASEIVRALRSELPLSAGWANESIENGNWNAHPPVEHWPWHTGLPPCYRLEAPLVGCHEALGGPSDGQLIREILSQPVASPSGPCFVDVCSAQQVWFKLPRKPEPRDIHRGICEVLVPPADGQIVELAARPEGGFLAKLRPGLKLSAIRADLAIDDQTGSCIRGTVEEGGIVFPEVPRDPFCIYIHEDLRLAAHYRGIPERDIIRYPNEASLSDTERLIRSGESDCCEFKEATGGPSKWAPHLWKRILRTIASFANSRGGSVLIGVNDDAEIVGLGIDERDPALVRVESYIRKAVQDRISNAPEIEVLTQTIEQKAIIRINVQPHGQLHVSHFEDEILIRSGSSTRILRADEFHMMFKRRGAVGL